MIDQMKKALESGADVKKDEMSKKPVRPQDLVRLYETIIQNLNDLPQLAGLEDDDSFRQETEAKVVFYKAWR
jgi:hypothetical protein